MYCNLCGTIKDKTDLHYGTASVQMKRANGDPVDCDALRNGIPQGAGRRAKGASALRLNETTKY